MNESADEDELRQSGAAATGDVSAEALALTAALADARRGEGMDAVGAVKKVEAMEADAAEFSREGKAADEFSRRACAWPRRLKQGPVRMITEAELRGWIVYEDARLLVVSKPGDVVCHPSKAGPWSSLVGAAREYAGLETIHLVFRLDRETSGVVVLAKDPKMASRLQRAMQERKVGKTYRAVVTGALKAEVTVNQALGDDLASPVFVKTAVREDGKAAVTHFFPEAVAADGGFSLVRVVTETGRKHQIRAHAQWAGHAIVGDKIYGPDDRLYLEFIDSGWTPALAEKLLLERQALHCAEIDLRPAGMEHVFSAPLAEDMRRFWEERVERR